MKSLLLMIEPDIPAGALIIRRSRRRSTPEWLIWPPCATRAPGSPQAQSRQGGKLGGPACRSRSAPRARLRPPHEVSYLGDCGARALGRPAPGSLPQVKNDMEWPPLLPGYNRQRSLPCAPPDACLIGGIQDASQIAGLLQALLHRVNPGHLTSPVRQFTGIIAAPRASAGDAEHICGQDATPEAELCMNPLNGARVAALVASHHRNALTSHRGLTGASRVSCTPGFVRRSFARWLCCDEVTGPGARTWICVISPLLLDYRTPVHFVPWRPGLRSRPPRQGLRAARLAGQAPGLTALPAARGRRGLRGPGQPAGLSRAARCAAPWRPEERPRSLRGAPGDERRRSRLLPCLRPARAAGPPRSRGVLGLLVVLRLSLGRGPAAQPVHQPGGVVPVHPGTGNLLQVGQRPDRPARNGDPARVHSVLYSPIVVSASALS